MEEGKKEGGGKKKGGRDFDFLLFGFCFNKNEEKK